MGLDDLQGQILVPLGGQDEPQPGTVIGGEPPVARRAAPGCHQALGLEEADFGDRHVREVRPEQVQDRSDRHPGGLTAIGGAH